MTIYKKSILLFLFFVPFCLNAQWGGKNVYSFLSVPLSPRSASLGGSAIAIKDNDLTLAMENPSLLNAKMNGKISLEYANYLADINFSRLAYVMNIKKIGTLAYGLQYMNAGNFIHTDELGNKYNDFSANELALNISYIKNLDSNLVVGATLKPIFSQFYHYNSFGVVLDVGVSYTSKNKLNTFALLFKNVGSQITTYNGNYEQVPLDIQLGASTKLAHAPFRISLVAHSLNRLKMVYQQTNKVEPDGKEIEPLKKQFAEHLLRHFIVGVEFIPIKSFFVRAGFNYQRRQELKYEEKNGIVGFSCGFGLKIKKFHINYSYSPYHLASSSHQISITTNLSDFIK